MEQDADKLYLKEGTVIEVLFDDGITKRYDMEKLFAKYPWVSALQDRALFLKGRLLGWGSIVWNDEIDVDAETVYDCGETVASPSDAEQIVFGYRLKKARLKAELTQEELSERTGVDQSDISKLEKGTLNPSVGLLRRVAKGLGKSISIVLL